MSEYQDIEAEWLAHEYKCLLKRVCPHSGGPLTSKGEAGPDRLSCWTCDCFGYKTEEVGNA